MIKPAKGVLLISPLQAAAKTESGLIMENNSNTANAPSKGVVVEAGEGCDWKKGDVVFWRRYGVDETKEITEKGETSIFWVDNEDVRGQYLPD